MEFVIFLLPPDDIGEVVDSRLLCPDCEKKIDPTYPDSGIFFGNLTVPWKDRIWWNWYEKLMLSGRANVVERLKNKTTGGFLASETDVIDGRSKSRSGDKRKWGEEKNS